jgi:hypothetical protein
MILYVNGDSHTAGAEAVNPHAFAEDDGKLAHLGRLPHPANLAVSWGKQVSVALRASFCCDAESASSNTRILRTTRDWLANGGKNHPNQLIIIQWSTWEREEWLIDKTYYQINGSGIDQVPASHQQQYKEFVANIDWQAKTNQAHQDIWELHQELESKNIPHIFFNGNSDFSKIKDKKDWGHAYIGPYDSTQTYDAIVRAQGVQTVMPDSWHFGRDGHAVFSRFILEYIIAHKFV